MLMLGIVLLVLALLIPALHVLFWIGVILAVLGAVLMVRPVGGRRWY